MSGYQVRVYDFSFVEGVEELTAEFDGFPGTDAGLALAMDRARQELGRGASQVEVVTGGVVVETFEAPVVAR